MTQTRFWCLTLNNPTDDDIEKWDSAFEEGSIVYLCYQREIAPSTGTPHLQGYTVLSKVARLGGVKRIFGSAIHAVRSNGTPSANRDYCSKKQEGSSDFKEFGTLPADPKRGKRSDFDAFKEAVRDGLRCKKKAREEFPEIVANYPRWVYDYLGDQDDYEVEDHDMFEWQKDLDQRLSKPAEDRKVIFVIDKEGNQGKTWFAKHYTKTHDDAQYMEPAKKVDMAYSLNCHIRVLFINVTRTTETANLDYLYSFIESVKDGMVFSAKYESRMKYLGKVHVVVMMNMDPNYDLLSKDRYQIINLV